LKQRHPEEEICKYADHVALEKDIQEVDAIYLWFLGLKERRQDLTVSLDAAPEGPMKFCFD
jgi:hypothetical protein